jgi:hypothetical protein
VEDSFVILKGKEEYLEIIVKEFILLPEEFGR